MLSRSDTEHPRWAAIPIRVLLITFLLTLLAFALGLLLGIFGVVLLAYSRGTAPDMTFAYRHIALPVARVVAPVTLLLSLFSEVQHYRRARGLAEIARSSS